MAQNKNNNKNGGDCCSFCGAKRTDVEIMFQGSDGANICLLYTSPSPRDS